MDQLTSDGVEEERASSGDLGLSSWIGGAGHAFCRQEFWLPERVRRGALQIVADPHSYANRYWQELPRKYPYENWLIGGSFLKYRVFLNGTLAAVGPFRSIEDGQPASQEYDVTECLKVGANVLAVLSRGEARGFALVLRIETEQGEIFNISSGPDWKQLDGNAVFRPVCWERPAIEQAAKGVVSPGEYPEHVDGLVYPQGWREADFDDGDWPNAMAGGLVGESYETTSEPPYALSRCRPIAVSRLGEGNYLVDFGRPVFGGVELSCPKGAGSVELRLGEELLPNGHARYQMRTGNCFQEIWRFAPGSEPLAHFGTRMFRYAEVVDWRGPFDAESISATAIGMPFHSNKVRLTCSDPAIEKVWHFCKNTIAHTTADVFTDCLTRERLCYEADSYITMLTLFNTEGSWATARRSLDYLVMHPSWPCEWWQFFIPLFHEYLLHSGDYELVEKHYEFLRDRTSYHGLMRDGLIREFPRQTIVDWPESERDGYEFGAGNAVANAFAHWDLVTLAQLARYIERESEAEHFEQQAGILRAAYNAELYSGKAGLYVDSLGSEHHSFHANLYALRFGLVPEERRAFCLAYLKRRGMRCSVFGAQFLLETLFLHGEAEAAIALITSNGPRSWLEMMSHGAVATTESWLTNAKENMSWAHPWGSAPGNVIVRHLFGLRPTEPGWRKYTFDPQPGGIQSGSLRLSTPRGLIVAGFARHGSRYETSLSTEFGGPEKAVIPEAECVIA